jgi:hypothetical protein
MKTFIQIGEIWVPSKDRALLEYHSGMYGPHQQFRVASERLCFGYDEGLPGKAWAARHPIILKDLQNSYFKRADAAKAAGLSSAVAMPVFAGDYLLAVMVLFCGDDDDHVGAIELWHNDPANSYDMGLVDGYYGIAENFEYVSRRTLFRPGFGLPGITWKSGMPELMGELWSSEKFLRKDDARKAGLSKGLGVPFLYDPGQHYVMTFLSAMGTPIARRIEIWVPTEDRQALEFSSGHCDRVPEFTLDHAETRLTREGSLLGRVWALGLPAISESIHEEVSAIGASASKASLSTLIALPILDAGRLKAVVAFYF